MAVAGLSASDKAYVDAHDLDTLMQSLMTELLSSKPSQPMRFMYHTLRERVRDAQSGRPSSTSKQPRPPSAAVRTPQRSSRPSLPKTPIASHGHSTPPVHKPRRRPLPEDDLYDISDDLNLGNVAREKEESHSQSQSEAAHTGSASKAAASQQSNVPLSGRGATEKAMALLADEDSLIEAEERDAASDGQGGGHILCRRCRALLQDDGDNSWGVPSSTNQGGHAIDVNRRTGRGRDEIEEAQPEERSRDATPQPADMSVTAFLAASAKKPQHAEHADEDEDDVDLLALTKRRPAKAALAQAPDDELLATWRTDEMDVEEYEVADSVLDDNLSVWSEAP